MRILFSFLRIVSIVWATQVITENDWVIYIVAIVWGLTTALEE